MRLRTTDLVQSALSKMPPLVVCSVVFPFKDFQNRNSSVTYHPMIPYPFSYRYYGCPGMLSSFCCLETVILTSASQVLWLKVTVCFHQIASAQSNVIHLGTGSFICFPAVWGTWMESVDCDCYVWATETGRKLVWVILQLHIAHFIIGGTFTKERFSYLYKKFVCKIPKIANHNNLSNIVDCQLG